MNRSRKWGRSIFATMAMLALIVGLAVPAIADPPFTWTNTGGFVFGSESGLIREDDGTEFLFFPPGDGTGILFFPVAPTADATIGDTWPTIGWGNQKSPPGACSPGFVGPLGCGTPNATTKTNDDPFVDANHNTGNPDVDESGLRITTFTSSNPPVPPPPPGITTGPIDVGETKIIATVEHANRPIYFSFLHSVLIKSILRIFDHNSAVTPVSESQANNPITLTETPNFSGVSGDAAALAQCEAANPGVQIGPVPCTDFFIFPLNILGPVPFTGDDAVTYTLTFDLVPGAGTAFDQFVGECDSSNGNVPEPCGRIRTVEKGLNDISITMTLQAPEIEVVKTPKLPGDPGGTFTQGGAVSFTIVVSNPATSTGTATNVVLTDQLPQNGGLNWNGATVFVNPPGAICTIGANPIQPGPADSFLSCALGDLDPGDSVTITVSLASTPPLACQTQPNPVALAVATNGVRAQDSGSITCTPPPPPPVLRTVTQGGWGAPAHGNNPGTILDANFAAKFPSGAVIGDACGFKLTFTTAAAVRAFLPQGGTPRALTASDTPTTNPTKKFTVFAGQILALTINVAFSSPSGPFPDGLGSFVPFTTGPAAGKTVSQILADANKALAGCGINGYASISQINDIVTSINEMFD